MVGTWFGRRFWGTGANRESKALVAHLAFDVLGMQRLGSYSNPDNVRSTRALLGVGFRHEGVLRALAPPRRRATYDVNVFGMLREDWEAGAAGGRAGRRSRGELPAGVRAHRRGSVALRVPAEAAHREDDRRPRVQSAITSEVAERCRRGPSPVTIAPDSPSIRCLSGSASAMSRRNAGRVVGVVEDAGDEDHRQEDDVHVGGRGVEVRDHVRAARRRARRSRRRRASAKTTSSSQSFGQPRPKNELAGERRRSRSGATALVTALPATPAEVGAGRQRRAAHALEDALLAQERDVHASAVNVVAMTLMPAMPGTITSRLLLVAGEDRAEQREEQQRQQEVEERRASGCARTSGARAGTGARRGRRRSATARPPRRVRARRSARGRRPRALGRVTRGRRSALAARQRRARQLVQQRGRVVGLALVRARRARRASATR